MKQFLLGFLSATLIFVGGYFALNNGADTNITKQLYLLQNNGAKAPVDGKEKPQGTVLCEIQTNSCSAFKKPEDSGNLKVMVTAGGKPMAKVEVDLGTVPGANKYYMMETDDAGAALFENIPTGFYAIYFNLNNFPKEYDSSQAVSVRIVKILTTEKRIELQK
ncbi:MAG: hypothetical protein WC788_00265 [Candidatus Paceibacterota bacterium]|jgi:hypothetical protein